MGDVHGDLSTSSAVPEERWTAKLQDCVVALHSGCARERGSGVDSATFITFASSETNLCSSEVARQQQATYALLIAYFSLRTERYFS